jgi:hypothetical protein
MRSQTYGDKQREAQQRKKQEELRKKLNPETAETPESGTDATQDQDKNKAKKKAPSPGRGSA